MVIYDWFIGGCVLGGVTLWGFTYSIRRLSHTRLFIKGRGVKFPGEMITPFRVTRQYIRDNPQSVEATEMREWGE